MQHSWTDKKKADRVEFSFRASKADNCLGAIVTRTRTRHPAEAVSEETVPAFEFLLNLLDMHSGVDMRAPLMQSQVRSVRKITSRVEATKVLRSLVGSAGTDP